MLFRSADLEVTLTAVPLSPTTNNIVTYRVAVTNDGPAGATNVLISDILPSNLIYVSNSFNGAVNTSGGLAFSVPVLPVGAGIQFTVAAVPTSVGYVTNAVIASSDEPSVNAASSATNVVLVGEPSADLGVSIAASADPVPTGSALNFLITVTNGGPSQANGASVINTLPPGFDLVSAAPNAGTISTNNGELVWSIGALPAGATVSLKIGRASCRERV